MVRKKIPCCDRDGLKRGTWTPEEDKKLMAYVSRYGCQNWRQLPKFAGLSRCGKSCRLRWMNYLRPDIKRGNYTKEEEDTILKLRASLGNRWSTIAAHLPGRTDNGIKNHWHTKLKKRLQQDSWVSSQEKPMSSHRIFQPKTAQQEDAKPISNHLINDPATMEISPTTSSPKPSFSSDMPSGHAIGDNGGDDDDEFAFLGPIGNFWTEHSFADPYLTPSQFFAPSLEDPFSPLLDDQPLYS